MRFSFPRILPILAIPLVMSAYWIHNEPAPEVRSAPRSHVTPNPPDQLVAQEVGAYIDAQMRQQWIDAELARIAAEEAQRAAEEAQRARQGTSARQPAVETSWPSSLYPCGGDLPPCYVKMRESGGDYNARNPSSTASGAWQFLDSTWAGFGGYPRAYLAPPEVQDERARQLWDGGRGCSHWSAC